MKTIKEINEELDNLDSQLFWNHQLDYVIVLLKKRLCRLTLSEEKTITSQFTFELLIEALPFIDNSLNFFKANTINLPIKFQQDLILKHLNNYDQIASSTEDIFVKRHVKTGKIYLIDAV